MRDRGILFSVTSHMPEDGNPPKTVFNVSEVSSESEGCHRPTKKRSLNLLM